LILARFPHEILGPAATRISNDVRVVYRVVYDITSKPLRHDEVGVRT
jgi:GMP synthase PP-ATPase subunit